MKERKEGDTGITGQSLRLGTLRDLLLMVLLTLLLLVWELSVF